MPQAASEQDVLVGRKPEVGAWIYAGGFGDSPQPGLPGGGTRGIAGRRNVLGFEGCARGVDCVRVFA
jgi:hypothetical protein